MQNQKTFYALLAALLLSTGQKALAEGLSVKAVRQINPTTVEREGCQTDQSYNC